MNPNQTQIGGKHYKPGNTFQTWDLIVLAGNRFLEGSIIKYITRYKNKDGIKDIEKSLHYTEKLISDYDRGVVEPIGDNFAVSILDDYCATYSIGTLERSIITIAINWETEQDLIDMRDTIKFVLELENNLKTK